MGSLKIIRSAARAVVICDGKLLVARMRDRRGIYYILPGGGQLAGETLIQTIQRECLEEVGILVNAVRLLYVREYIGKNHNFSRRHHAFHQVEHVFLCEAEDPTSACPGSEIDNHQVGVSWLALDQLHNIRFYPEALRPFLADGDLRFPDVYMGDCN